VWKLKITFMRRLRLYPLSHERTFTSPGPWPLNRGLTNSLPPTKFRVAEERARTSRKPAGSQRALRSLNPPSHPFLVSTHYGCRAMPMAHGPGGLSTRSQSCFVHRYSGLCVGLLSVVFRFACLRPRLGGEYRHAEGIHMHLQPRYLVSIIN